MIEYVCGDRMKNLLNDLISFIQSISLMDLFFFGSIIVLLILIVVLIYIIRLNDEKEEEISQEETQLDNNDDELDLAHIAEAIEEEEPKAIVLNNYEKEQEAKAIISYDELVATTNKPVEQINYKKEEDIAGLKIKAVDLDNLTQPIDLPNIKGDSIKTSPIDNKTSVLISYDKEEEFLNTLKKLQNVLN